MPENRGDRGGSRPSNFETVGAIALPTLTEKCTLKIFNKFFFFGMGVFKIKWPKSEEKCEFGGR